MKTVRIYLRGGQTIEVRCKDYKIEADNFHRPTGIYFTQLFGENIVYANMSEIAMVTEESC